MKKFLLVILGILCLIVLLAHVGSMIALAISLAILYLAFKKFIGAEGMGHKVIWATVALIALGFSLGNVPSLIGLLALAGLIYSWRAWHKAAGHATATEDPFDHFEREWKELH